MLFDDVSFGQLLDSWESPSNGVGMNNKPIVERVLVMAKVRGIENP